MDALSDVGRTEIWVYNTDGFIPASELDAFCNRISKLQDLEIRERDHIRSTVFRELSRDELEVLVYEHGYVVKISGTIAEVIFLLDDISRIVDLNIDVYVSPVQRIENLERYRLPRSKYRIELGHFLDSIFKDNKYSKSDTDSPS